MRGNGSSRPAAQYWCLIDTEHRVADLYGMVNVPQAVWIDAAGRIVRPPENAGSTDHFRLMDRTTRTLAPEHQAARLAARTAYLDAVRDWVLTGRHALPADAATGRMPRVTPEIALAQAHFRLGVWLRRHGNAAEGDAHLAEASRLHPEFVEHLAPGRRSGRGRQGQRRRVLAARAGAWRAAVLSAAGVVARLAGSRHSVVRGTASKQSSGHRVSPSSHRVSQRSGLALRAERFGAKRQSEHSVQLCVNSVKLCVRLIACFAAAPQPTRDSRTVNRALRSYRAAPRRRA